MSATDHTIKLGLPLFRDDDKPTWRGDINDMSQRIDDGYAQLDLDVSTANNNASSALQLATSISDGVTATATEVATRISNEAVEGVTSTVDGVRHDMDAFIEEHQDDGDLAYVDAVSDIGLDNTGTDDCADPLNAYIVAHPEGGFIMFRAGNYRFNRAVNIVRSVTSAPWVFMGVGAPDVQTDDDGDGADDSTETVRGGTNFVNNVSASTGMFVCNHDGRVTFEHIRFISNASRKPFIDAEGSATIIQNCAFRGPLGTGHNCSQVGVNYGTYSTFTQGGYGQVLRDCSFDRVGRAVQCYNGANGLLIENIVGSSRCGNSGDHSSFLFFDGTGGHLKFVTVNNVILESHAYYHCVYMKNAEKFVLMGVQGWDNSWMTPRRFVSAVYLGEGVWGTSMINCLAEDGSIFTAYDNYPLTRRNRVIGPDWVSLQYVTSTDRNNPPPFPCLGLDVNDGGKIQVWDGQNFRPFSADDHT